MFVKTACIASQLLMKRSQTSNDDRQNMTSVAAIGFFLNAPVVLKYVVR